MQNNKNAGKPDKTNWIRGLDSLRFVLALIVFLSHLGNPYHELLSRSPHLILRIIGMTWGVLFSGVGAVMAFFIISGFVIHYPNKEKVPETKSFLVRRWLRIGVPLLVISLFAGYFHIFSEIPIWSLYCELIYYSLYPFLIRIRFSWGGKFFVSFLLSILLIAFFGPDDWNSLIHQKDLHYNGAYWQLGNLLTWLIGLPCWLLGVMLANNIDSFREKVSTTTIYLFRILVLITGISLDVLKFHFFFSYFFSMNFFALILFVWIKKEILYYRDRQPIRSFEFFGKFSYSLYLCHNVFTFFIIKAIPLNVYTYFPIIVLTAFSAYLFYLAVEKPSHLLSRRLARSLKGVSSSAKKLSIYEN